MMFLNYPNEKRFGTHVRYSMRVVKGNMFALVWSRKMGFALWRDKDLGKTVKMGMKMGN